MLVLHEVILFLQNQPTHHPILQFYSMQINLDHLQHQNGHTLSSGQLDHIGQTTSVNPSRFQSNHLEIDLDLREQQKDKIGKIAEQNTKTKTKKNQVRRLQRGVEDNPQYYRVDLQTSNKLYQIYRKLKVGPPQHDAVTFDQKEQSNSTMNYHKVLEIFKDIDFKLEINQKLTILRSIKKFSFNHSFISKEEFVKVFKVIVHGLGIKQHLFRELAKNKYTNLMEKQTLASVGHNPIRKNVSIKLNKNFGLKLKTQQSVEYAKQRTKKLQNLRQAHKTLAAIQDRSFSKKSNIKAPIAIAEQGDLSTSRRPQHRKRIATDVSRYEPKQVKQRSYLTRAIEKSKVNKVSWDSLFKMNEGSAQNGICIPSFVSKDLQLDDIYF